MEFLFETGRFYSSGLPNDARLARLQRENELKALLETSSNFKVSFECVRFDLLLEKMENLDATFTIG